MKIYEEIAELGKKVKNYGGICPYCKGPKNKHGVCVKCGEKTEVESD